MYKESTFPLDYREAQVRKIMNALSRLRSIAVIGLAGMGKSNIVRFVVSHPDVREYYLGDKAANFIFVHIDCNQVNCGSEQAILEELSYQWAERGFSPGIRAPARQAGDPIRELQRVLVSQLHSLETGLNVAIFLDRFDQACKQLAPHFFAFLRSLRDERKNVCFVFASRRSLGELFEFQELLDDPCWVGPLNYHDALGSIARDETRLGTAFSEVEKETLIKVTGGHPGLLKNATELLHDRFMNAEESHDQLATRLLESEKIQDVCQDLWADLTSREQEALGLRARDVSTRALDPGIVTFFVQAGLLVGEPDGEMVLFSKVFERFIRARELGWTIEIVVGPLNEARIQSWKGVHSIDLAPLLFRLLQFTAQHPEKVHTRRQLSDAVYGVDQWPVTLDALGRLVKRLRAELNPALRELTGDAGYDCLVAVRGRGYRLRTTAGGGWHLRFTMET
jgi:hypothetical protein